MPNLLTLSSMFGLREKNGKKFFSPRKNALYSDSRTISDWWALGEIRILTLMDGLEHSLVNEFIFQQKLSRIVQERTVICRNKNPPY